MDWIEQVFAVSRIIFNIEINKMAISYVEKQSEVQEIDGILNPYVKKWFYGKFPCYSIPQRFAVTYIHSRQNILVSAPTGATKSLTAFMSVLNELVDSSAKGILEDKIYCIYISPLKSLNNDIERNLSTPLAEIEEIYGKKLGIRVAVRTGDTTQKEKSAMLAKPPHILITTPESLAIMLTSKKFKERFTSVEWTIIDEIHSFAENKRGVSLSLSLEFLNVLSPGICRVGLSATVSPIEEIAKYLVGTQRDCKIVDVSYLKEKDIDVLSPVSDFLNETFESLENKQYALMDKLIQSHRTTLIFTNTRSATEKVVHHLVERFPGNYSVITDYNDKKNIPEQDSDEETEEKEIILDEDVEEEPIKEPVNKIGAHHSSLSKEHRLAIEQGLRDGKLKCVVCSTSLELGIDIGYIDLVILLGSPKSVARGLQRIGRAGHKLHSITKGRIVVLDRDDLVECSILLKNSIENRIDDVHIPTNCLDVLSQNIIAAPLIFGETSTKELFEITRKSYCYSNMNYSDFYEIIKFLAGEYVSLEKRYVYAKIRFDHERSTISTRGKMGRVLYMTNAGTIPDSTGISVKIGEKTLGVVDESFAENLKPGDIFVLGGSTYLFKFTRGQTMQVSAADGRKPTVPNWSSQMLPLCFDLAKDIGHFRRIISEKISALNNGKEKIGNINHLNEISSGKGSYSKEEIKIIDEISEYTHITKDSAKAIYNYFLIQHEYVSIPHDKEILIEEYIDEYSKHYFIFHALYGRRVVDCISRAYAYAISRKLHSDVEIGINDNGFYISPESPVNINEIKSVLTYLSGEDLYGVMGLAIESSEILARRFRQCASRAFLILRNYHGKSRNVGRQQISSKILYNAVKEINPDFVVIKEAKREVLEDVMDIENASKILKDIHDKKINITTAITHIPSPFASHLILQGYSDILKASDKLEFLKEMHKMVLAKISLKGRKTTPEDKRFSYDEFWKDEDSNESLRKFESKEKVSREILDLSKKYYFDALLKKDFHNMLIGDYHKVRKDGYNEIRSFLENHTREMSKELIDFIYDSLMKIKKAREDIV